VARKAGYDLRSHWESLRGDRETRRGNTRGRGRFHPIARAASASTTRTGGERHPWLQAARDHIPVAALELKIALLYYPCSKWRAFVDVPWLLRIPSFGTRPLNSQERDLLIRIFGDSINLDPVRVAYIRLISAGTAAYTMGNTILIPVGTSTDTSTLVHEMTHVWPYQTMGTRYISDSALHQAVQGSHAYDVDLVAGQSFYSYAAEPARWLPAKL